MSRRVTTLPTSALILVAGSACDSGNARDAGGNVNADTAESFSRLMRRPDIDDAAQQAQQMDAEIRNALSQAIGALATWQPGSVATQTSCSADYPGIDFDGQTRGLPSHKVPGKLPDAEYEKALTTISSVAHKYGVDAAPQRLHDSPGSHGAGFHNVHDDGQISFGTANNTSLRINVGCHLIAEAKKRGAPAAN